MIRPALLVLALACLPAGGAEVYRCVTENGVVRYSDKPCSDGKVDKLAIENKPTDPEAVEARNAQRREQVEAAQRADAAAEKAAADATKQQAARDAECQAARDRVQELAGARRITRGEGENRSYLDADEIVKLREEAQQRMQAACGG